MFLSKALCSLSHANLFKIFTFNRDDINHTKIKEKATTFFIITPFFKFIFS